MSDSEWYSESESESESSGSEYVPSSCEDDEWYSEELRIDAYSDLDCEDDATESASSRELTDVEGECDDEEDKELVVEEVSNRLSDLGSGQASTSNSSKRPRATSAANPPGQKRKKHRLNPSPESAPFSKIVDEMEGDSERVGKGPWVDRLLHPSVLSIDR